MSTNFYDVVVIGMELPELLCAALLARRGFRVLVVGQDSLPPSYEVEGFSLKRSPYTFLAAQSPIARRALSELAVLQLVRRRATALDPALQVAIPGHRIDLALDEADLLREIEREFPEVKRPIEDFHRNVLRLSGEIDRVVDRDLTWPPETFLERREMARATSQLPFERDGSGVSLLGELPDVHPFRAAAEGPVRFASHLDRDQLPSVAFARLYGSWFRGAAVIDGGADWLRQALVDRITTAAGDVRPKSRVDRILVKRGVACGVRLAASGEEIGATFVVAGTDLVSVIRLMPDRSPFEELFERLGEPQPRFFRYTLNLVVAAEGVPMGMARDVFFVRHFKRPLFAENLLRLEVSPVDSRGHRLMVVEALLPRRGVEEVAGYRESVRERVLESLGDLIPFLSSHLLLVDSPHDGRDIELVRERALVPAEEPWSRGPAAMKAVWGFPVRGALGVCALPVRMPVRHLLLCNRQVVPGLGEEGDFLSAWSAARVVTRSDRKKEWMRRGLWTKVEI